MAIDPSGLTAANKKELKQTLETKLSSLRYEIKELEAILTEDDSEDKGAADEVDRSSFEEEMQRTQLVLDGKNELLYEVSEAIKRFEDGTYGICEETEEPIGIKRLTAQPWTRLSLEAQKELELRRKNRAHPHSSLNPYPSYNTGDDSDGGKASGASEE